MANTFNCKECRKEVTTKDKRNKFCSHKCDTTWRWKNNPPIKIQTRMKEEYEIIRINGRYSKVHRKIWEETFGEIPEGYVVHHRNGIKIDNRIENLELMKRSKHQKLHNLIQIQTDSNRKFWGKNKNLAGGEY